MTGRVRLETGYWLAAEDAARVGDAVASAIAAREDAIGDEHDSRYLHPARSVLILLSDAGVRSAAVLSAAAFLDSIDSALAPEPSLLRTVSGEAAAGLLAQVPTGADDDELLEALVSAPAEAALIALAERLDHARHLQFRRDLDWHGFHGSVERVWIPAAHRVSAPLARRFERWAEAFRRRLLLPG